MFVNYSDKQDLQQFHGKATALDITHRHATFPSLFIIHELRIRGFQPFQPISPAIPIDIRWQEWIVSDGVIDNASGTFRRNKLADNNHDLLAEVNSQPTTSTRAVALNPDVISEIPAARRAMPSWGA